VAVPIFVYIKERFAVYKLYNDVTIGVYLK